MALKSVHQITKKIASLRIKLQRIAETKGLYENFGDKEQRILKDYIGDIFDYPYDQRKTVYELEQNFFDWCINYTG